MLWSMFLGLAISGFLGEGSLSAVGVTGSSGFGAGRRQGLCGFHVTTSYIRHPLCLLCNLSARIDWRHLQPVHHVVHLDARNFSRGPTVLSSDLSS